MNLSQLIDMLSTSDVSSAGNASSVDLSALDELSLHNDSLEDLFKSQWFYNNISRYVNISSENLTSLLKTSQTTQTDVFDFENHRDPLPLLSALTIFYAMIFIAGILGNLITCIVISRNKFMHTATNFYLFNLAVSDLILLISGMPPELYNIWYPMSYPFTDIMCIIESILSETAANATVLTITAFTVERYIAICHPFRQHTMSKLSRAIKFILAIWMTAFLLALPQAMQFAVIVQNDGKLCSVKNDFIIHVFAVSGFIFFVGPMTAICVLYVLIGVKLKRSRMLQAVQRRCYDINRGISAQSRVIRMLIAVAVAFFLCWAPFHSQRLMAVYGSTTGTSSLLFEQIYTILTYTSGVLYFLSTCINPLLYNIMSHKFRDAFKVTLARQFGLASKYQKPTHNYSALNRLNGSMRMNTTDSIRTHGSSCRAHRMRCISVSSQSTLMTSLSKNDVFAPNNYSTSTTTSQIVPSTPGNRNSQPRDDETTTQKILESEMQLCNELGKSCSFKAVRKPPPPLNYSLSKQSIDLKLNSHKATVQAVPVPKSLVTSISKQNNTIQNQINSINELANYHNQKSKDDAAPATAVHSNSQQIKANQKKTLQSLTEKFRWHTRRKVPFFGNNNVIKNSAVIVESPMPSSSTQQSSPTNCPHPPLALSTSASDKANNVIKNQSEIKSCTSSTSHQSN